MYFLNNRKAFDHAKDYGIPDAFFDLATTGFQATQATHLGPGETCIVAKTEKDGRIRFTWYSFSRVEIKQWQGVPQRVFCGPVKKSETVSKGDAARDPLYSIFFNKNGDFKRRSVLHTT
jgi:hypothetical protein